MQISLNNSEYIYDSLEDVVNFSSFPHEIGPVSGMSVLFPPFPVPQLLYMCA
jgi:hypothetical protein